MKFAAIGRTKTLVDSIRRAVAGGHICTLIITTTESPESAITEADFEALAQDIGATFLNTRYINQQATHEIIRASAAQVAISLNWQFLINNETLNLFPQGIINSHVGDLPRYRGNATPNWALIMGETSIPMTLHFMDDGLDTGDILLQRSMPLTAETRVRDIYDFSAHVVPKMFSEVLTALEKGALQPKPQPTDPTLALRCYPRLPQDSFIDWHQSAEEIQRLVQAVSEPFNGAYTYLGTDKLIIWRAYAEKPQTPYLAVAGHVVERRAKGEIAVATGDGFLIVQDVQLGDGQRCKAGDIIKSVRLRLGMNLADEIAALQQRITALESRFQTDDS
ncbi:MAG: formyltransferase family protein [Anaerolineae bacterium]|nr:formyltransferase family protein [Anaerolineae bacterium]MDQ7037254.1 formyltransferase family protein [Anaerolineae bacterium]